VGERDDGWRVQVRFIMCQAGRWAHMYTQVGKGCPRRGQMLFRVLSRGRTRTTCGLRGKRLDRRREDIFVWWRGGSF
jgi:hypothetical protein